MATFREAPVSSCFASSSHRAVPKVNAAFCTCRDPRWGLRGSPRRWECRTPAASTHTRELSPPRATVQQCHPRGATEPSFCSCPSRRPSCRRFSSVLSFLQVYSLLSYNILQYPLIVSQRPHNYKSNEARMSIALKFTLRDVWRHELVRLSICHTRAIRYSPTVGEDAVTRRRTWSARSRWIMSRGM